MAGSDLSNCASKSIWGTCKGGGTMDQRKTGSGERWRTGPDENLESREKKKITMGS
jgi:hypothetical protein